jgi:hypothetical protein
MFGHGDGQQYLDLKPRLMWVDNGHLSHDQAGIFEVTNAPPARGPRHARNIGQLNLAARSIILQGIEKTSVGQG